MCISYSSMYILFWPHMSEEYSDDFSSGAGHLSCDFCDFGHEFLKWGLSQNGGYPTGPMMLNSMGFLWLENLRIVGPAGPDVKVWLQPPASCLCLSTIINGSRNNISVTIMSGLKTSFPEPELVLTIFKPHAFDTTIESPYSHHLHPLLFFILLTTPSTAPSRAPRSRQGYGPAIASKICTGSWCPLWSKRRKSSRWAERWVVGWLEIRNTGVLLLGKMYYTYIYNICIYVIYIYMSIYICIHIYMSYIYIHTYNIYTYAKGLETERVVVPPPS